MGLNQMIAGHHQQENSLSRNGSPKPGSTSHIQLPNSQPFPNSCATSSSAALGSTAATCTRVWPSSHGGGLTKRVPRIPPRLLPPAVLGRRLYYGHCFHVAGTPWATSGYELL